MLNIPLLPLAGLLGPRLLLIEDEPDLSALVAYHFRARGFQVTCAETGQAGLKAAASAPPDVVILDRRLPDLDGLHLRKLLRRVHKGPILVWTALRDARVPSGRGLLEKGCPMSVLEARVRSLIGRGRKPAAPAPEPAP